LKTKETGKWLIQRSQSFQRLKGPMRNASFRIAKRGFRGRQAHWRAASRHPAS
jgi:hypothetical protein